MTPYFHSNHSYSEYTEPAGAFKKAGHSLTHVGLEAEKTVTGKKDATPVKIDKSIDSVSVDDFDALLIPGGYSPDKLRVDANVVKFIVADVFAVGACAVIRLLLTLHHDEFTDPEL